MKLRFPPHDPDDVKEVESAKIQELRLNEQLEFYLDAHGAKGPRSEEVPGGVLFAVPGGVVYYKPDASEIGFMAERDAAENYLHPEVSDVKGTTHVRADDGRVVDSQGRVVE